MTIKIAVLGAGRWGVHLIRNFLEHPQAHLVAVVDPNPDRLEAVRTRHQLDDRTVLATDWATVRQLPSLDAVAIATPASTHYTLVADALRQGYHVLAEKPLTLDPTECQELCRLAEQQQRQLVVDHTYLFHPAVERGKTVVQKGTLGDLRYGYAARTNLGPVRHDVDAMWDLAIHDIAIFNTWLGEVPTQVQASGRIWLQGEPGGGGAEEQRSRGAEEPGREEDKEKRGQEESSFSSPSPSPSSLSLFPNPQSPLYDLVWVTLTYKSGFQAFIHLCWLNPDKQRRLAVVGSQGTLIFDELSAEAPLSIQYGNFEVSGNRYTPVNLTSEVLTLEKVEPLRQVCDRFLACVSHNTPSPISSGWVGTQLVTVLHALTKSLQQGGQPISL